MNGGKGSRARAQTKDGRSEVALPIDVRKESQIDTLMQMFESGRAMIVLVYADWCGHCHNYLPTWHSLEKTPGRTANIASVHHDIFDKISLFSNAKIDGFPSVIKVNPDGTLEQYNIPGSSTITNANPNMRDVESMVKELRAANPAVQFHASAQNRQNHRVVRRASTPHPKKHRVAEPRAEPGAQSGIFSTTEEGEKNRLLQAGGIRRRGFHATKTYKSPKRNSHRASTRKQRRS